MAKTNLTAERARHLFTYDPATGLLTWRVAHGRFDRIPAGTTVGTVNAWGYLIARIDKRNHPVHRVIWLHQFGEWPAADVDHINGARTDNRLANLRAASRSENMQNRLRPQRNNKTGVNGICWDSTREKFVLQVKLNSRHVYRKRFDTLEEAAAENTRVRASLHPFAPNDS